MIVGEELLVLEILYKTDLVGAKSPIFDVFARSDSAATLIANKVQLILIGSLLHPLSNEPKMNIVRCP